MTTHALTTKKPTRPDVPNSTRTRSRSVTIMTNGLQLINEALSRARMRRPQDSTSEAFRPARQIAMRIRREQNRMQGERV
jgi:hypothetical protein